MTAAVCGVRAEEVEDPLMRKLRFPGAVPELLGDSVRLRELTEEDVPAWYERATDAESAALAGDPIPESPAMGLQWLQRNRERFRQQTGIRWAIVPKGTAFSVGSIGLAITSSEARVAQLGFVIGRVHWGQGIATDAARAVVRFAFETLGLAEIRAELLQSNLASRRVLEKAGFQLECAIPDFDRSDTGSQDGYLYILRGRFDLL
jgi:ribosomal-protein-alanine N-acetyltransferase